jgi:hypothetical protein
LKTAVGTTVLAVELVEGDDETLAIAKQIADVLYSRFVADWWAHLEFTRINIDAPTILRKIEDLPDART